MAISLITGGNLSGAVNNGASVTLTFPAGVQQNDIVYVCSGIDGAVTMGTSGYTLRADVQNGNQYVRVWRKVMGATPDTSVTVNGTGQNQDAHAVVALILRGVDTANPEDVSPTTATGTSTNPDNPAITTSMNRSWVLAFANSRVNDATITAPSGYENQTNANATDNNPSTTAVATKEIAVAGTENPPAWQDWDSGAWGAVTIALMPGGFVTVNVSGVGATTTLGDVTVNENEVVSVTGVSATGQIGDVRIPLIVKLTGVQATGETGSLNAIGKASVVPTSVLGITELGEEEPRAFATVAVTGVQASGAIGDITFIFGTVVRVEGVVGVMEMSYADVWSGIDDSQFGVWSPVDDTQPQDWRPAYV